MTWALRSKYTILLYVALHRFSARAAQLDSNPVKLFGWYRWQNLSDQSQLYRDLCNFNRSNRFRRLLDPMLVPRIVGTESHEAVGQYIETTLKNLDFTIEHDRFIANTPHGNKTFANIIATLNPNASRRLVFACHYDSKIIEGQVFIGATDSAVPCAMLLDIATSLAPLLIKQEDLDHTLQLIFFDGEEAFDEWSPTDSIYGARHLASVWEKQHSPSTNGSSFVVRNEMDKIALFVLLDLLGARNPKIRNFAGNGSSFAFSELVQIESSLMELDCLHNLQSIFDPLTINFEVEDDHLPFLKYGLPVLHLIPIPFPAVWHTAKDNAEAIDMQTVDNFLSIFRIFIARFFGLKEWDEARLEL